MVTLEELKSTDCRWPAETQNGEMLYCGEPVLNDCPYCAVHAAIAYNKPAASKEAKKTARLTPLPTDHPIWTAGPLESFSALGEPFEAQKR